MYLKTELKFNNKGKTIFGELFLPSIQDDSKRSIIILSHGFGSSGINLEGYAKFFADNGLVAYTFDFIGGGDNIRSDGNMTEMSVLTEATDLNIVLDGIRDLSFIDTDNVYLMGNSQGGFVSTYVACENASKVKKLILLYPAFNIPTDAKKTLAESDEKQELFNVLDKVVSRKYGIDAETIDIYAMMKKYNNQVLIIHGDMDNIVSIAYSEKAVRTFNNAELKIIKNAGHGFHGNDLDVAQNEIKKFLFFDNRTK